MSLDAAASAEVTFIRQHVPGFEPEFQRELDCEDGEMGAFQAISLLGEWVSGIIRDKAEVDAVSHAFAAIEQLIVGEGFPLGDELAAEFIEAVSDVPGAEARMGPVTRARSRG